MRQAVEGAEAPDQFRAINRDDAAIREKFRQGHFGDGVTRIVEGRQEDTFVRDVEVRVAGWQSQIFAVDPTPGVPEPATWAMMLLGFGAAGVAVRRSRRKKALVTQFA